MILCRFSNIKGYMHFWWIFLFGTFCTGDLGKYVKYINGFSDIATDPAILNKNGNHFPKVKKVSKCYFVSYILNISQSLETIIIDIYSDVIFLNVIGNTKLRSFSLTG